ncbi:hypothetical protein [Kaistia sp. MMO-174]|uniref:hypothetical protein n=1 Tax=Kaistia sp. MMO-174 TaxID=3081256 RepID=UPI00301AEA77
MDIRQINEDLFEIGGLVRIERGPARHQAKATAELLSDECTAAHYQVGMADAAGKVIELGKTMTYLDWQGERGWYLYVLIRRRHWLEYAFAADQEAALEQAKALAAAPIWPVEPDDVAGEAWRERRKGLPQD